jgi:hypothetical protein
MKITLSKVGRVWRLKEEPDFAVYGTVLDNLIDHDLNLKEHYCRDITEAQVAELISRTCRI